MEEEIKMYKIKRRTKSERQAYRDGFVKCAECVEMYLSIGGKKMLESLLMFVESTVDNESESEVK